MFGRKKKPVEQPGPVLSGRDYDRFMGELYKLVGVHRDSDAVCRLMQQYDYLQTRSDEFEALYRHVEQWGASRTLLCLGRLIIYRLDRDRRHDQVLVYIEKCQRISPRFVLPELARVTFYARRAVEAGKLDVAKNLVVDHRERYGEFIGSGECDRLLNLVEPDIDVTGFELKG